MAEQATKAATTWMDGLESEVGLIPFSFCASDQAPLAQQPQAKAKSKASSASAKSGARSQVKRPEVLAAKMRAKTTKELCDAERMLNSAQSQAMNILNVTAPAILGDENVDKDSTLDGLRDRLELVITALDDKEGSPAAAAASSKMYELACQDPYLKDCRTTILSNQEACQTLGQVRYFRKVTLDVFLGCLLFSTCLILTHSRSVAQWPFVYFSFLSR